MEDNTFLKLLAPEEIIQNFELREVKATNVTYELIFEERKELIPTELTIEEAVLDGFCNTLSLLSFPIKGTKTYLIIKRIRWKQKGGEKHYSNEYSFNYPGVKATKEFASFLKEVYGHTPDQYLGICGIDGG